jgi:hypothetical protein
MEGRKISRRKLSDKYFGEKLKIRKEISIDLEKYSN